jgi:hypothetical protein
MIRRSEYLVGTEADWAIVNPVVQKGQLAVVTPINAIKIGDGVSRFDTLDFVTTGTGEYDQIDGGTP